MMLNCLLKCPSQVCHKSIASLAQVCHKSVEMFVEMFVERFVTCLLKGCRKVVEMLSKCLLKGCRKSVERLSKCLLKGCCVYLSQVFASHRKIIDNLFDNIFNSFNNLFLLHDILIEVANFKTMIFFSSKWCTFILFIKSM